MKKSALFLTAFMLLTLTSCRSERPPEYDTTEPPALNGVFSSENHGTLTFNGDGQSITTDTTQEFERLCGLPEGEHEGSYVFLFHNGKHRYDKAETFRITIGEESYQFANDFTQTNETAIVIRPMEENTAEVVFEKKE